jgi:hypothetical protein
MENKIGTYVRLYLNDIELNINVKEDLGRYEKDEALHQFGYIEITDGRIEDKPLFYDNLTFFIECDKKEFKKECKTELKEKERNWKEVYKDIKTLLKRAKKLNII